MNILSAPVKIIDYDKDCFHIKVSGPLTGSEAAVLRNEVAACVDSDFDVVYIDVKDVTETDLSGINEVIHSHYTLDKAAKKLILLYRKESSVETWVRTTGLDKFVATAIVPTT